MFDVSMLSSSACNLVSKSTNQLVGGSTVMSVASKEFSIFNVKGVVFKE